MNLSPLQIKYYLSAAVFAMLVVFELVTRLDNRRKIRSGECEDMRRHNTKLVKYNAVPLPKWRIWTEGLLIIAAGVLMALTIKSMRDYYVYGAFYDSAWRDPDVEDHLIFDSMEGRHLEDFWKLDPENYDWTGNRVVLVKLGCEDCERVAGTINALADQGYTIVFSRSPLGQAYVEKYGINYVPSVIMGGLVVQLRSGDSIIAQPAASGEAPSKEEMQSLIDSLTEQLENGDWDPYGTKAAIEAAIEAGEISADGNPLDEDPEE